LSRIKKKILQNLKYALSPETTQYVVSFWGLEIKPHDLIFQSFCIGLLTARIAMNQGVIERRSYPSGLTRRKSSVGWGSRSLPEFRGLLVIVVDDAIPFHVLFTYHGFKLYTISDHRLAGLTVSISDGLFH